MIEIACPNEGELLPLATDETASIELQRHVDQCPECSSRVEQLKREISTLVALGQSETGGQSASGIHAEIADEPGTNRELPSVIGRYQILSVISSGGQGIVYRAFAPHLNRDVAIKVLKHQVSDPHRREQLVTEGRLLASLDHPNLVRIHDLAIHEGRPFLVLDHIRGRNLRQYAAQNPGSAEIARLLAQVAGALAHVHSRGVAHLDLKPQNIVVSEQGQAKLLDFGLSRLKDVWKSENDPVAGGTPSYMAPEQARAIVAGTNDVEPGPASDIFGLGAVLYFMLTGKPPFEGSTSLESLDLASRAEWDQAALRRSGLDRRLVRVCRRAMATAPAKRYSNADEMASELVKTANRPPARARRRWLVIAGLMVVALVGLATWRSWPAPPPAIEPAASIESAKQWSDPDQPDRITTGRWFHLSDNVPVADQDLVRMQIRLPADLSECAAFVGTPDDGVERIPDSMIAVRKSLGGRELQVPPTDAIEFRISASRGTCLILICARRQPAIDTDRIIGMLSGFRSWPELSEDDRCIVFDHHTTWIPNSRGIEFTDSPDKELVEQVDALRQLLGQHHEFVFGIVFQHQ